MLAWQILRESGQTDNIFKDYKKETDFENKAATLLQAVVTRGKCFDLRSITRLYELEIGGKKTGQEIEGKMRGNIVRLPFEYCWFELPCLSSETGQSIITVAQQVGDKFEFVACSFFAVFERSSSGFSNAFLKQPLNAMFSLNDESGFFRGCGFKYNENCSLDEHDSRALRVGQLLTLYSLYLLNWKREVKIIEEHPSRQVRRACERLGKRIPASYCRIDISRWAHRLNKINCHAPGASNTSHSVRAHSISYSEKAPMFNCVLCRTKGHADGTRPHIGNFWKTAHFSEDHKVYRVEVPGKIA